MTSPENFSYELINGKLKICTSNEHKFGTDAFLLSDFAQVKRKDRCVDLGTGCGIISCRPPVCACACVGTT